MWGKALRIFLYKTLTPVQVSYTFAAMKNNRPPLRTIDIGREDGHVAAPRCQLTDCNERTRERKPYCPAHIDRSPYIRDLLDVLEQSEAEMANILERGVRAARLDSLMAQEIKLQLELHGRRTVDRLARDLACDRAVVLAYAKRLARAGHVRLGETTRGRALIVPVPVRFEDLTQRSRSA